MMSDTTGGYSFNNICPKCGKPYFIVSDPIGDISQLICQCHISEKKNEFSIEFNPVGRKGWICPKCERVFSPDVTECPYCRPNDDRFKWEYNVVFVDS